MHPRVDERDSSSQNHISGKATNQACWNTYGLPVTQFRNSPELFRDLAFSVWTRRLPQFDRISLRVMQVSKPAVGIRLRVNLDRDSRSL